MTINKLKNEKSIGLKMEQYTKVNGKDLCAMVWVYRYGQMELNMKDFGSIMLRMVKENFGTQMEMCMMGSGATARSTGAERVALSMGVC